jgi:hypothetical protein
MTSSRTVPCPFRTRLLRGVSLALLTSGLSAALFAQDDANAGNANANNDRRAQRRAAQNGANANGDNGNGGRGQRGGNFDPAEMQQRMMTAMREQFGVTDDAEWKLITDRITAVTELRRAQGGGFGGLGGLGGFRGGQGGQGGPGGGRRGNAAANPEQDALRQAITDNLPDAEIKSRLARLRDARKANEEKLTKAQEELRAVLSVRQEAVAVMAGLLP